MSIINDGHDRVSKTLPRKMACLEKIYLGGLPCCSPIPFIANTSPLVARAVVRSLNKLHCVHVLQRLKS